jgi:hypothetical protein
MDSKNSWMRWKLGFHTEVDRFVEATKKRFLPKVDRFIEATKKHAMT